MTIEEFENKIMQTMSTHISEKNKERMRWFIVKIKGEYAQKQVSITSLILDDRFQMHTMCISVNKNYEEAFSGVIRQLEAKFIQGSEI